MVSNYCRSQKPSTAEKEKAAKARLQAHNDGESESIS